MASIPSSKLVSLISKTVPKRVFEKQPVDPLSEFVRKNLASIEEELRGLNLAELETCQQRFKALSKDLDDDVSATLGELVLKELKTREDGVGVELVPTAAQNQLGQFLSLEQGLREWIDDPETTGEKEEAAARIRNAFLEDSASLDLSGLGLTNLPDSMLMLQNLREVKLFKNAFTIEILSTQQMKLPAGARLVHQEHYTGKDSARQAVLKASSLSDVDIKGYKSLEERRLEKSGQMWDCLECKPDSYGGFRYRFSLRPEYLDQDTFQAKQDEIFPAVEPDLEDLEDLIGAILPDALDLGFEYGGQDGEFYIWIPDVEALTARYAALREAQPGRGLTEDLGIVESSGIASDLDFVEALITHNGLVSDSLEFFHDMTIHTIQLLVDLLEPGVRVRNTALFAEWTSLQDFFSEFSLPDLDLSKRESVWAAANALEVLSDQYQNSLGQMGLLDRVQSAVIALGARAVSLTPYSQARYPFAAGVAQAWGKLLLLKEKLAGGLKSIPLENQGKVKELIAFLETSLGAVTDLDSLRSTHHTSLVGASFSRIWDDPDWREYANRRYGKKGDDAYVRLIKDLKQAWDAVERFVVLWRSAPALRHFVDHDLKDWENAPNVAGDKSEAVKRILASLEQSEDGCPSPSLNLSKLGLSRLPKGFESLKHLTSVDLSENQFDRIPKGVIKLPYLKTLDLSHNHITSSEDHTDTVESEYLEHLNLSNNNYRNLSNLLLLGHQLRSLDFSDNGAEGWFPWQFYVSYSNHLETLDLSGNQFSGISGASGGWRAPDSLREIKLSGSPLDAFNFSEKKFIEWAHNYHINLKF